MSKFLLLILPQFAGKRMSIVSLYRYDVIMSMN